MSGANESRSREIHSSRSVHGAALSTLASQRVEARVHVVLSDLASPTRVQPPVRVINPRTPAFRPSSTLCGASSNLNCSKSRRVVSKRAEVVVTPESMEVGSLESRARSTNASQTSSKHNSGLRKSAENRPSMLK